MVSVNTSFVLCNRCLELKVIRPIYHFAIRGISFSQSTLSSMPKPANHTIALKNHRQKLKEKNQKYSPGTVTLQVLGSGGVGAPKSLYIFTDQSRYLFNCGEGSQRLAHEHKMKLSKLEHIFITQPIWENIGGLPGVSLTIQDVGVPQITVHGPPGTDEIFFATRRFVVLRHLTVKMADCNRNNGFEDNVMKVKYVPLSLPTLNDDSQNQTKTSPYRSPVRSMGDDESTDDDVDYYAYWKNGSRPNSPTQDGSLGNNKKRRHFSPDKREKLEGGAGNVSMAYVCRLQDRPGTLNLEACVAHGVPPGPLLGQLKAGQNVTLPNGKVVLSTDVTSPLEPGPVFIIVECPNEEFLDNLLQEEAFKLHQSGAKTSRDMAHLVVHFTPQHIMENARYVEWMERFPVSTHHMVLNSSNPCLGSVAVHRIQHKLHMLSEQMFPLLADTGIPTNQVQDVTGSSILSKSFSIIKGNTCNKIQLRPQQPIDNSPRLLLEPELYIKETLDVEGFPEALADLKARLATLDTDSQSKQFPQVVFLGTGSCIPNKTRNTSGILLHLSEKKCIVVDCGEGTYGQIVRLYGETETEDIMRRLQAIYVSHLHADHHIGLVGLLKARLRATQEPLYLLAPRQIRTWLNTYHNYFEPILNNLQLIPNCRLDYTGCSLDEEKLTQVLAALDLRQVNTCEVKHCPNAFGISFTHVDGWKITYSGDTMPCDDLIQLGKGSDLLIHEATMEDDLESEAKLKMHSTTSQAIDVGRQMGAKFTLLTHFSQRYAKVPIFNDSFNSDVGIAFDNMCVRLCDLPKLPLMYDTLKLMFAEHYEEMELKAVKRQLQQEREIARSAQ